MVEAAKGLIPVLIDCSKRGANADLISQYGVKGFPTVKFLDTTGKEIEALGGRGAPTVKAQIEKIVAAHTKKVLADLSLSDAHKLALQEGKLLAVMFTEDHPKHAEKNKAFLGFVAGDEMAGLREQLVLVKLPLKEGKKKTEEAKRLGASKSPTLILAAPPASGELEKDHVLKKFTSPKDLVKKMTKAMEKHAKEQEESSK